MSVSPRPLVSRKRDHDLVTALGQPANTGRRHGDAVLVGLNLGWEADLPGSLHVESDVLRLEVLVDTFVAAFASDA